MFRESRVGQTALRMQHLEAELLVLAELFLVEGHDVLVADAEAGGVEVELRLFLGCDSYSQHAGHIYHGVELFQLRHIVQNRDSVVPAVIDELGNIGYIGFFLVTVAYNV